MRLDVSTMLNMTVGWDTHTRFGKIDNYQIFRVILSVVEESRGNETALYICHFTSFRYREIATPNKSARNDKIVLSPHNPQSEK